MEEPKKYTLEEIKKYLRNCDSFGDALYFCTPRDFEHMLTKNDQIEEILDEQE